MMDAVARLRDRQQIIELLAARAMASDDHDVERMVACHTEDGSDDHGDGRSSARAFIEGVAAMRYADPDNGPQRHQVDNVSIDFTGPDTAFVESYHLAYHRLRMLGQQSDELVGGRYLDRLRRVDGRWLIEDRTVVYDWSRCDDARDPSSPRTPTTVRPSPGDAAITEETSMASHPVQDLLDKQAITEVLYRRARAGDRREHALALTCYHPGATETHEGFSGPVEDFLLRNSLYAPGRVPPSHALLHIVTNVLIDLRGDEAFVESYHLCLMSGGEGESERDSMIGGRYLDTFARRDDVWAITHREVVFDWSRTEPAARRFWADNPRQDLISFGRMDGDDPLYRHVQRLPEVAPRGAVDGG